jgi:hypothetical protein
MRGQLTVAGVLILQLSSFAQNTKPLPAPADVSLQLSVEGDQHQFHLGELIPVRYSYSADTPGKYDWVGQNKKLEGGRGLEISCSPTAEPASSQPSPALGKFDEMLNTPCGGVDAGFGSGCGDCDWEQPLSPAALGFGPVPLNTYLRFRRPGVYTCVSSSADVATAFTDERIRPALLLKSNPLSLTIVSDPAWAQSAALSYAGAYNHLCQGDDVPQLHSLQCFDIAERITYLDTLDSLAVEVKFFDGRSHGWENGFWDAIQQTSQPSDALRLMTNRIQDPDFQVSATVLESLAAWDLGMESPDAFQTSTPETYHADAVDKLRKYVQLLGSSLSNKSADVLRQSAEAYRAFAEQKYCERQPLIQREERNQILTAIGSQP